MIEHDYFDEAISFDNLYKGLKRACKNVRWKDSVVGYEFNGLKNTLSLRQDLLEDKYKIQPYQHFIIYEPKRREIVATRIRDRQFQSALCYAGLYDDICEHFIRDNCACQIGKGTDDAINRLKLHMSRFYNKHGIEGYVLKCDIKHFFQSIDHGIAKKCIEKYVSDKRARREVFKIIDSYNTGIGLGSEISQLIALSVLNEMDHMIKEKLHIKYYVRYMDDFILIHEDKEYLRYCLSEIRKYLETIKLELNSKTTMHPLKQGIKFLQWKFIFSDSGKILMLMDRKKITKEKERLRKLLAKEYSGEFSEGTSRQSLDCWLANAKRGNTYRIQHDMLNYYYEKEREYEREISQEKVA